MSDDHRIAPRRWRPTEPQERPHGTYERVLTSPVFLGVVATLAVVVVLVALIWGAS